MDGRVDQPLVVSCIGDGLARGLAHGESIRDEVRAAIQKWESELGARTGRPPAEAISALLDETDLKASVAALTPDLLEEVRGIARGANLDIRTVLAYNLMDEEWWFFRDPPRGLNGCTVVARLHTSGESRRTAIGQTMDRPASMDGSQIVLRVSPPGGPDALVLSAAGMIGLTGVNSAGIAVCVNTLSMLEHSANGLPVAFVLRLLVGCTRLADATAVLRRVPHASGQQYLVASAEGAHGFECSAAGVWEWTAPDDQYLAHTNHPISNTPLDDDAVTRAQASGHAAFSQRRLEFVRSQRERVQSATDLKQLLADRTTPICVHPSAARGSTTFGAVVFEPTAPPSVAICLGMPDRAPWHQYQGSSIEREAARA
jgi:isopenicillin-N N-acyltransferase-like protein